MTDPQPHISIIIAVYNSADTLQRCIDSVKMQEYPYKELVVIDGDSTDGSVKIIEGNAAHIDYWESEPDRGIYHAWNKGLDHAVGNWIHFLGADDYFMDPGFLAGVAEGIAGCPPDVRVVYGNEAVVSATGDVLEIRGEPWEKAGKSFLREMSIPHPVVFHRRDLFEDHGRFDESFLICADYELLLRELKTGRACFLPDVVKAVGYSGASKRWDMMVSVVFETARAQRMNGIFPYRPSWFWFFAKTVVKSRLALAVGDRVTRRLVDCYRLLTGRPRIWTRM